MYRTHHRNTLSWLVHSCLVASSPRLRSPTGPVLPPDRERRWDHRTIMHAGVLIGQSCTNPMYNQYNVAVCPPVVADIGDKMLSALGL